MATSDGQPSFQRRGRCIREQAFVASSFALVELKKIGFSLDNTSK